MSILIKDVWIVSQDALRRQFKGSVYVEDEVIREVKQESIAVEAEYKINGEGKVLLPGLINTHTHIPMTLLRGYGDDMVLEEWLKTRIWPVEAKLDRESILAGTDLGLLEMILSGTTCFADMYFFEDMIAERTIKAGLRGFLGFSLIDFGTPEFKPEELFLECEKFIRRWKSKNSLVTPVLAPHSSYTCSPETLERCAEVSERHNVLVHTHCSETQHEVSDVQRRYGVRPVEQFKKTGLLNRKTILAHCGWITKGEVREIARAGAGVSHNPVSNMKLATGGFTPIPELVEVNATVGLGTDGAASNNTLDMFETMKFVALIHKHHRWDPCVTPAQQVLDFATIGGAKAFHMEDKLGSVEEGKLADLIILDFKKPHLKPCYDVVSHLVYAARGCDVYATIVNGKPLMIDRRVLTMNYEKVLWSAEEQGLRLTGE